MVVKVRSEYALGRWKDDIYVELTPAPSVVTGHLPLRHLALRKELRHLWVLSVAMHAHHRGGIALLLKAHAWRDHRRSVSVGINHLLRRRTRSVRHTIRDAVDAHARTAKEARRSLHLTLRQHCLLVLCCIDRADADIGHCRAVSILLSIWVEAVRVDANTALQIWSHVGIHLVSIALTSITVLASFKTAVKAIGVATLRIRPTFHARLRATRGQADLIHQSLVALRRRCLDAK